MHARIIEVEMEDGFKEYRLQLMNSEYMDIAFLVCDSFKSAKLLQLELVSRVLDIVSLR